MKAKVSEEVKEAFIALQPNRNFQIILAWLEESLKESRENNDYLEGIALTRSQGEAITLNKILKTAKAE